MIFLYFVELIFILIIGLMITTQIIVPTIQGTKWFPLLRRKGLESQLRSAAEEIAQTKDEIEIQSLKSELTELRAKLKVDPDPNTNPKTE